MTDSPFEADDAAEQALRRAIRQSGIAPLDVIERAAMEAALERARGNVPEAARALGISKKALYQRIARHSINLWAIRSSLGSVKPASLEEVERVSIEIALEIAGGNVSAAARTLGISRSTLYQRIEKHDINRWDFREY